MFTDAIFPLYSPGKDIQDNANCTVLVADLRVQHSYLSCYTAVNGKLTRGELFTYNTADFASFDEMVAQFRKENAESFSRVAVAVPGPVIFGRCETTNLPFVLDIDELQAKLGVQRIYLINDMEAAAYGLASLDDAEVVPVHESAKVMPGNVALLAPGHGLGEAGLFWDGEALRPFATEGGHTEFSPRNEFEVQFYQYLNNIYGIVSWENVLSKDGLYNIYRFLRDVGRHQEDKSFADQVNNGGNFIELLSAAAKSGHSRLCRLTVDMYAEFLAREANYLVLKLKATGGLVISGEITEVLRSFIDKDKFYADFKISDKMENLLKDIPIYFVFKKSGIADGAAFYGAFTDCGMY